MKKISMLILISISILLLMFLNNYRNLTLIESYIKDTITFTGNLINKPLVFFKDNLNDIENKKDLYKKYNKLKENYDNLLLEYNKYKVVKNELNNLKNNVDIKDTLIDYNIIHAYVINRNIDYFHDIITINKGSNSKIKKGMLVINSKGLIGVITNTTNNTSTVSLLTNYKKKISISIGSLVGFVYDYKDGYLLAEVDNNKIEDKIVYTTGFEGNIKGIKIGEVKKEKLNKFELAKIIYIKPYVDFNNIDYVMVIGRIDI